MSVKRLVGEGSILSWGGDGSSEGNVDQGP
jgi:hypothetical protein